MFKEMLAILTKRGKLELALSSIFFCLYGISSLAMLIIILITIFNIARGGNLQYLNILILFVLVLFKGLCNMIADIEKHNAGFCVVQKVREMIILSLKNFSLGFYTDKKLGSMNTILHRDIDNLSMVIAHVWSRMIGDFLVAFVVLIYIFILNYKIGFILFLSIPIALIFLIISIKQLEDMERKNNNALLEMVSVFVEYVRGMPILKSFARNDSLKEELKEKTKTFSNTSKYLSSFKAKKLTVYDFILDIGYFSLVLCSSMFILYNKIDVMRFIIFIVISKEFYRPFFNMEMYYMYYVIGVDSYKRLKTTFNEKPINDNKNGNVPQNSNISFNNVCFNYKDSHFKLKNISFEIKENTITALVGSSGSGKTSITNLLLRFYDLENGSISIGGIDIKEIPYDELLKRVGFVLQNTELFDDTIEGNIKLGNKNASFEEVIEASKKARIHDFIMTLPKEYQTRVGEDASFLSGGQRQRISIARTLLKNPTILILDEVTSNIDVINEKLIQESIIELSKNKTIIVITHRLNTIKNADNILVLKNGMLVESGKHDNLISRGGEYYRLYQGSI